MTDQVAAVAVRRGDRVLLIKRAETLKWSPGKWCFPTGHLDVGETPLQAAVRETLEETGLSVSGLKLLAVIELPGRTVTCFQADDPETKVAINSESTDWAWVPVTDLPEWDTTPEVSRALMAVRIAARYKNKKEVDSENGGTTTVYEYSERQVALRNSEKAKRIENLRKNYSSLESQVKKDLGSKDNETFLTALAVALMDETYERVGNDDSADEGHFGVTGWQRSHVSFSGGKATITYVGKSGVKHKKTVTGPIVKHLRKAYDAAEGEDACLFCPKEGKIDATKINAYLKKFDITAKDLRGYHANDVMKSQLKKVRKGELPSDPKERKELLKKEFKQALEATAKEVGHEPSTLRSQYLVPGLEDDYTKDGTVSEKMTKGAADPEYVAGLYRLAAWGDRDALGVMMAGLSMLLVQSVIVNNPFFDEKEIKRYLKLRRQFHQEFVQACEDLADGLEQGRFGEVPPAVVQGLKAISRMSPKQDRQALRRMSRLLRGLQSLDWRQVEEAGGDRRILKLVYYARRLDRSDPINQKEYAKPHDYDEFIKLVLKLATIPAPIRTLLRKALKLKRYEAPSETANPGAWFDMSEQQKTDLRELAVKTKTELDGVYEKNKDDPEKRRAEYLRLDDQLRRIREVAGVNFNIITREEDDQEPLDKVLKREAKLEADGPTEYVLGKVQGYIQEAGRYRQERTKGTKGSIPMEFRKLLTKLGKAKTFSTVERIVKEAIERNILGQHALEDIQRYFDQANKNRAVREGRQLVPLKWEPKTPEQFQADHNTGEVWTDPDMSDKERDEMLGRVSRAVEDLEGIFGKGFCGKHAKKLDFKLGAATGLASASYFTWDDPSVWQPRVKFGEDYEGLLAHELSHYFEDMLAFKIEQAEVASGLQEKPSYGGAGPGQIFINTGVPLSYLAEDGTEHAQRARERIGRTVPELVEFVDAVLATPDYQRWTDILSSAYDTILPRAVENLAGMSYYELPKDHPYYGALDKRYKSELPPELVEEADRAYREMMGGDVRKLSYLQSGIEVWARMCEQYVYTKLCQAGVSNPWLTQLTYDTSVPFMDKFMDEETFDKEVLPILDRLFARLNDKNILTASMAARLVRRWAAEKIRAYKVMRLDGNELVAGANSRLRFPARKGATIRMPGNGVYMSPNKRYVLDYYSGLADDEVLLTLEFDRADIKWGNLTDREAEVAASPVKIIDIEPLDD